MRSRRLRVEGELVELAGPPTLANDARRWRPSALAAAALAFVTLVIGAVTGFVLATRGTPSPLTLPVMRFVVPVAPNAPLANLGGYDVVISRDGKRIAYYAQNREAGTVSLYLRELDSLEARVLPGTEVADTGSGNMNPFFSPDGTSLGFFAPDRGVVRLTLDGGPPTKIMDPPEPAFVGAEWAADDTLVFSAGNKLQRVPIAGGNPQTIATAGAGILFGSPVLLPGGRAAVFTSVQDGQETIEALDFVSHEQKVIVRGAGNPTYASSGHLVFARGTSLMAAAFDPATLSMTGEPVPVLSGVRHTSYGAADYGLSATGTLAYVTASDAAPLAAAVWVDRKGNVLEPSATEPLESPRDPRLSPDGTRLALTTGGPDDGRLWIYDLTGRPPIPLSADTQDYRSPVWSPDGNRVVSTIINQGVDNVFTLRADGSELTPQPLAREKLSGVPGVWSSAGEIFMVRPPYSNGDITVTPAVAAGQVRDVVKTEWAETDPALSPDGRWLAYASNRSGRNEIWVQGYPNGVAVRVSRDGGYEPRWSADGRELFYLQANAMMSVAVDTSKEFSFSAPVKLFENPYFADASPAIGSYDVAKDGRFLMFQPRQAATGAGGPAAIVVVPNWTEELKRRVPTQR